MSNQAELKKEKYFKIFEMDMNDLFFIILSIASLSGAVCLSFIALTTPMLPINSDYYCSKKVDSSERPSVANYNECMKSEDHYRELLSQLHDKDSSIDWFNVRSYVKKMEKPSHQRVYEYLTNDPQKTAQ